MKLLITNIGILAGIGHEGKRCLRGTEMSQFNTLEQAYLYVEDGKIVKYGVSTDQPTITKDTVIIDAKGGGCTTFFLRFTYTYRLCW